MDEKRPEGKCVIAPPKASERPTPEPFSFPFSPGGSIPLSARRRGGPDSHVDPKTPNRLPSLPLVIHGRAVRSRTPSSPSIPRSKKAAVSLPFRFRRIMEIQHRFQVGKYRHNHRHDELENQLRFQSDAPFPSIPGNRRITPRLHNPPSAPVEGRGKRRFYRRAGNTSGKTGSFSNKN